MPVELPKPSLTQNDRLEQDDLWNGWLKYFSEVEATEQERQSMEEELGELIAFERYADAAKVQQKLRTLDGRDVLTSIHQDLDLAIKEERYSDAARLRDEGLVGLSGWWLVRGHRDPRGQLMHISKEFCRYSGRLLTSTEFLFLCHGPDGTAIESIAEGEVGMGAYALEVFLKRDQNGVLQHQGCVLRSPELVSTTVVETETEAEAMDVLVHPAEKTGSDAIKLTLSITQREDEQDVTSSGDVEVVDVLLSDDEGGNYVDALETEDDGGYTPYELQYRVPADIKWWDRNQFVLSVDDEAIKTDPDQEQGTVSVTVEGDAESWSDFETRLRAVVEKAVDDLSLPELLSRLKDQRALHAMTRALHNLVQKKLRELEVHQGEGQDLVISQEWPIDRLGPSERVNLEGEVMLTRLPEVEGSVDPFTGLYMGKFGVHGLQLLYASRHVDRSNGRTYVHVRKITGDPNVPSGELAFRALIERENRSVPDASHAEDMGIRAQYRGKGRIAETGFQNPRWVEGAVLVLDPTSLLAGGAELGLIWNVPYYRRTPVFLHRMTLPELL